MTRKDKLALQLLAVVLVFASTFRLGVVTAGASPGLDGNCMPLAYTDAGRAIYCEGVVVSANQGGGGSSGPTVWYPDAGFKGPVADVSSPDGGAYWSESGGVVTFINGAEQDTGNALEFTYGGPGASTRTEVFIGQPGNPDPLVVDEETASGDGGCIIQANVGNHSLTQEFCAGDNGTTTFQRWCGDAACYASIQESASTLVSTVSAAGSSVTQTPTLFEVYGLNLVLVGSEQINSTSDLIGEVSLGTPATVATDAPQWQQTTIADTASGYYPTASNAVIGRFAPQWKELPISINCATAISGSTAETDGGYFGVRWVDHTKAGQVLCDASFPCGATSAATGYFLCPTFTDGGGYSAVNDSMELTIVKSGTNGCTTDPSINCSVNSIGYRL